MGGGRDVLASSISNFWTQMESAVSEIAMGLDWVGVLVVDVDVMDVFFYTLIVLNIFVFYIFLLY